MRIVADSRIPYVKDYFAHYGELILKPGRLIKHADVKEADILLVRSITRVDAHLLQNSKVKFVGSVTAGADHLDINWLTQAGIDVSISAGFNAPPVADYVLSTIAALRKLGALSKQSLQVGIIGVGHVGRIVEERLRALNYNIVLCDPLRALQDNNFQSTPLNELANLDLITIHVPLTHHGKFPTFHFIEKYFLKRQKPGCVLINTSRGGVINSEELLDLGRDLVWCLDVWEHEPNINQKMLAKAFFSTPHIAGYSRQSKIRGIDMIYHIACKRGIIKPQPVLQQLMPVQELAFRGEGLTWEDVVLGVFNPAVVTNMMKEILLSAKEPGVMFDEMRNQFNYRYEFEYTKVIASKMDSPDRIFLEKLGFLPQ